LKKEITIEDTISKNSKRTVKKYLEHDYINPNITRKKLPKLPRPNFGFDSGTATTTKSVSTIDKNQSSGF
jgi:hypothetical protein